MKCKNCGKNYGPPDYWPSPNLGYFVTSVTVDSGRNIAARDAGMVLKNTVREHCVSICPRCGGFNAGWPEGAVEPEVTP